MNKYEFELHRKNQPNEIIEVEGTGVINAYFKAKEMYPDVMGIVSTDPTIDLRTEVLA